MQVQIPQMLSYFPRFLFAYIKNVFKHARVVYLTLEVLGESYCSLIHRSVTTVTVSHGVCFKTDRKISNFEGI